MLRTSIAAGLAVLVITNSVPAADSPQVQALKQEVKTLRAQRDAAVKAVHAQYDAVINQTKMSEAQLSAARGTLAKQEQQLAALGDSANTKEMQANMEALRGALKGDIKLDAARINALRAQRAAHVNAITAAYDAKIKALEAAIRSAPKETASTAKPKKK